MSLGLLICLPQLILSAPSPFSVSPAAVGRGVFTGLVSAAFVLCCSACLITADAISAERREGTLGLLRLTRVRGLDILIGKFASGGLSCLFALVALVPMLMLPVLAGGVTGGEAFRTSIALLDTLFLALAVGLWASARASDKAVAFRRAILLLLALIIIPPLIGLLPALADLLGAIFRALSPLTAVSRAGDASYKSSPEHFWYSLFLIQAMGWLLLLNAGSAMRGLEAGEATGPERGGLRRGASNRPGGWQVQDPPRFVTAAVGTPALPPRADEYPPLAWPRPVAWRPPPVRLGGPIPGRSPIDWLLARQRGLKPMIWTAALISFLHLFLFQLLFGVVGRFIGGPGYYFGLYASFSSALGLAAAAIAGSLFAWAASRFFIEARRNGELELLLTTPLGAREIVSAQWEYLKRLMRGPLVLILVPMCLQSVSGLLMRHHLSTGTFFAYYVGSGLLNILNTILGLGALCWAGLWFGFRAESQLRAILWTVSVAKLLPYAVLVILSVLVRWMVNPGGPSSFSWTTFWLLPQLLSLLFYLWLIGLARRRLLLELSGTEPIGLDARPVFSSLARSASATLRRARHWTP